MKLNTYLDDANIDIYGKENLEHSLSNFIVYDKLDDIMPGAWKTYDAIICIVAMGAVVRKIAPLLQDKSTDPAVLVINLDLTKIVPLLSGHLGGANELASTLTTKLPNCINFITTATDQTNTLSFEMEAKENDWEILNIKALANISNRLLNKQEVKVCTYFKVFDALSNKENLELIDTKDIDENSVIILPNIEQVNDNLTFKPKVFLGIGCNRDTSFEEIQKAIFLFLVTNNLKLSQIKNIASFDAKSDEVGLLEFANKYNFDIKFYKKDNINSLENEFSTSQATKFFGLKGVAEPASILVSKYKELIIKKEVYNKQITIAGAI